MGQPNVTRPDEKEWQLTDRSITYVDDSIGQASTASSECDKSDLKTLATTLMGPPAYNLDKTEGPSRIMDSLGWQCDVPTATVRPWWQWLLRANFSDDKSTLSTPAWFLAQLQDERERVTIYTDASTTVGGGYIWHGHSYGATRWSHTEIHAFGTADQPTDINGLEMVTAICAVIAEREMLSGKLVHLRVDNMSAVVWLNKTRSSQAWGQAWMRMLVAVLLEHDILLTCTHIPGEDNICADLLSRDLQTPELLKKLEGLKRQPLLSAASREKIWAMSSIAHSPQEYLSILKELEQQDSTSSSRHAPKCSTGQTHTSPAKTPSWTSCA